MLKTIQLFIKLPQFTSNVMYRKMRFPITQEWTFPFYLTLRDFSEWWNYSDCPVGVPKKIRLSPVFPVKTSPPPSPPSIPLQVPLKHPFRSPLNTLLKTP